MNGKLKRFISLCLCCFLCFSVLFSSVSAYGYEEMTINGEKISLVMLSDKELLLNHNDNNFIIGVKEDSNQRIVTVEDTKSHKKDFIKYDKSSETVYSSFTNKTIRVNAHSSGLISPMSETEYETRYVSYSEIRGVIGMNVSLERFVAAVLIFVPGAAMASTVLNAFSTIFENLGKLVPDDPNHGVACKIKKVKYYRTRMGRRQCYRVDRSIVGVSTY